MQFKTIKNLFSLFLIVLVLVSCEEIDEPSIGGTYISDEVSTSNFGDVTHTRSRSINFYAGGEADLSGGEKDFRVSYKIKGNKIHIEKDDEFVYDLTFKRQSDGSLKELENNSIWKRVVFD